MYFLHILRGRLGLHGSPSLGTLTGSTPCSGFKSQRVFPLRYPGDISVAQADSMTLHFPPVFMMNITVSSDTCSYSCSSRLKWSLCSLLTQCHGESGHQNSIDDGSLFLIMHLTLELNLLAGLASCLSVFSSLCVYEVCKFWFLYHLLSNSRL